MVMLITLPRLGGLGSRMDLRSGRKVRLFSFPRRHRRRRGRPPSGIFQFGGRAQVGPEQDQAFPRRTRTGTMFSPFLEDSS
jgi:hypothetical protein